MADTDYDIAICGAGPVGLTLALSLIQRGMAGKRIVVIDAKPLEQAQRDPRSIALSYGSAQILDGIGVWPVAADPIHQIHVSRRGHFGRTVIDRDEYGVPALGYVVRYGKLVTALALAAAGTELISLRPMQVVSSAERSDAVELKLVNGTTISATVMVQAEGGVFSEQSAKAVQRDYGQTAIIAHVIVSAPVLHRAFERFTGEGPLALLPQDDGYALVWCARPGNASRLLALSDTAFLTELGCAFGQRLGRFTHCSARISYPLGLNADPAHSARTVAIGNAAQTLHPVAGQGLNLGLRDAAVLARMLSQEVSPDSLQRFVAHRKTDRGVTVRLTDTMARIFASAGDRAPSQILLGLSLSAIDGFAPAKRLLTEQLMFGARQ